MTPEQKTIAALNATIDGLMSDLKTLIIANNMMRVAAESADKQPVAMPTEETV